MAELPVPRTRWVRKLIIGAGAFVISAGFFAYLESRDLPSAAEIQRDFRNHYPALASAHWVRLSEVSPKLRAAVIASEDRSFYQHHGFDYEELRESFLTDVATREWRRGGSTISQQVAKNVFLQPEKTLPRKFREGILTWRLERALSKDEILEYYLNVADWGDETPGAEPAAHFYFAKPPAELTWSEAALLAAMLSNPHRLNPGTAPQQLRHLRDLILLKLLLTHAMNEEEYNQALTEPLPRADVSAV